MTDKIYVPKTPIKVGQPTTVQPKKVEVKPGDKVFGQVLKQQLESISDIKFSAHAAKRLESRGINLTSTDLQNLKGAVDMAAKKGARESLVLMDNLALVVSIKNRTVITAVDGPSRKENVFTNIDSAVIM